MPGLDRDTAADTDTADSGNDSATPGPDTSEPPWPNLPCHPGPLDIGDDDFLVPFAPGLIFLAPFAGSYSLEDADVEVSGEEASDSCSRWVDLGNSAALDLDRDGYPDLAWESCTSQEGTHSIEVRLHSGPITAASTWTTPDAVVYDPWWTDGSSTLFEGLPDITGDGERDLVVQVPYGSGVDESADTLFVIDRWVQGTESFDAFPNRLVGPPDWEPPDTSPVDISILRFPSGGDVNGDGFGDVFTYRTGHDVTGMTTETAWVALGPVDGIVSLPDESVQFDIPCRVDDCGPGESINGTIIPDMTGDGRDDIVIGQNSGNYPGVAWLFPGCEEW